MDPVWSEEPAYVLGAVFGGIGFLIGVGAMTDLVQMDAWHRNADAPRPTDRQPAWTRYFGVDYNHKVIGIQYGVTGLIMLMIGGGFAVIFRTELARTGLQFLDAPPITPS